MLVIVSFLAPIVQLWVQMVMAEIVQTVVEIGNEIVVVAVVDVALVALATASEIARSSVVVHMISDLT